MIKKIRIELPQNCYTREYLEESGIHCEYSILDTAYINGPGRVFYIWCAQLLIPMLFMGLDYFWFHLKTPILNYFLGLASVISLMGTLGLLIRHFVYLNIRNAIRRNLPITVEPVAIVLIPSRSDLLDQKTFRYSKTAVVYKECGTRKPKFYMGAVRTGMIEKLPAGTALLYRHARLERYFSIDSEYELKKTWDYARNPVSRQRFCSAVSKVSDRL